ncbi:zinc ribbon domain-containing protein [Promethearchaeum syntrophicum]|uniref:Zinc ribbon domain-containing protein n=1 Tax=Promethearchaeum syntrophicum TaxID=2594042 RepID=A0A5B9D8F9_9ARCH|nr:zinc ribbon domain-containing protein [Candidatus Prometheoarchaeum syntrophicum]QEE15291.1 hypothetical protein DSAG12_01116 [Candidatus Prometheoarchaeum syntrophicum]
MQNIILNEFNLNPNITVEEISINTGITLKDVRAIIFDLKATGRLRGTFSQISGKMQTVEISNLYGRKIEKLETISKGDQKFCVECGSEIDTTEDAQFCAYCGSKL